MGKEKSPGSLNAGFLADVVALEGDPTLEISVATSRVRRVMKGGEVLVDKTR